VVLIIGFYLVGLKYPVLSQRPFTDIAIVTELLLIAAARALMRTVPLREMLPSSEKSNFQNTIYGLNIVLGVLGIGSLLYLSGAVVNPWTQPVIAVLAISNLALFTGLQVVVILVGKQ
jgi:hypothetical protein